MRHSLFAALLLCLSISYAQSVWIADNNPNAPTGANIFPTMQEAIDAATAGDTIYIQPSNTLYGTGTTNIELHFRGIGFNLDKDVPYTSDVLRINLYGAPDGSTNASNSTVSGLNFPFGSGLYLGKNAGGDLDYTLTGVRIYNNFIYTLTYNVAVAVEDLLIAYNSLVNVSFNNGHTNTIIRNNVIDGNLQFFNSANVSAIVSNNIINGSIRKDATDDFLVIQNNNFIGSGSIVGFSNMQNAIISNNIFYGSTPSNFTNGNSTSTSFQLNVFSNNISFATANNDLPPAGGGAGNTGGGNLVDTDPLFTSATLSTTWQSADDYTLGAGSPALGAGTDATDIGISGGPYPFGTPNLQLETSSIPTIQSLNVSSVINVGQDLQVDVSAKSN